MNNLTVRTRLHALVALVLAGNAIYGLLTFSTLDLFRINGPFYKELVQQKNLLADILPPPQYIIESYLTALQMATERSPARFKELTETSRKLKEEYCRRHDYWLHELPDSPDKHLLLDASYKPAMDFYGIVERELIPALKRGDREAALGLAHGALKRKYEQHRLVIDEIVLRSTEKSSRIETFAKTSLRIRINALIAMALLTIFSVFYVIWFREIRLRTIELEQSVSDRTSELQAANTELEAFSYSVSHDLRAPLRKIDGFSKIVLENYGPQLPEEGRRHLQTIRRCSNQMERLIDDLLTFSRLSRMPLNKQDIDTNQLVRQSLDELSPSRQERKIEVRIGELPPCQGDPALLKQVWINLLSNALKYTNHCEKALIEIGCTPGKNADVYFVRDNGAGFDMQYAHKLFAVFQRLHRAEDYEGTGVGLAIVHRIIQRHGGRVWADAALNRGATFYFTLGATQCPPKS